MAKFTQVEAGSHVYIATPLNTRPQYGKKPQNKQTAITTPPNTRPSICKNTQDTGWRMLSGTKVMNQFEPYYWKLKVR